MKLPNLVSCLGLLAAIPVYAQTSVPDVTIFAAGDIADCRKLPAQKSGAAATAELILRQPESQAPVLTLGDNTYPNGAPAEFTDCYAPTWGQFKDRTYPAPGNHDYYTPGAKGYFEYFAAAAGPHQRGYYRFVLGAWQVYSLNSYLKPEQHQAQLAWLQQELAANPARCILAYWHHPMFSSGGHGNSPRMKQAWQLLQAAGADLVLTGHDHTYERFAPQDADGRAVESGIMQFVVGTGGSHLYAFGRRAANSLSGHNESHGVLKLVLKQGAYTWQYLTADGHPYKDAGSASCTE